MALYISVPDESEQRIRNDAFRAATRGLPDSIVATAMNRFTIGINWTGSQKKQMREEFATCHYASKTRHARKPTVRELCRFLLDTVDKHRYGVRSERTRAACERQGKVIRQMLAALPCDAGAADDAADVAKSDRSDATP